MHVIPHFSPTHPPTHTYTPSPPRHAAPHARLTAPRRVCVQVDEADVPAVARTLLKAAASAGLLDSSSGSSSSLRTISGSGSSSSRHSGLGLLQRAVSAVRQQGRTLAAGPLAVLLMDVLAHHLPLSSAASRAFLHEAATASARAGYAATRARNAGKSSSSSPSGGGGGSGGAAGLFPNDAIYDAIYDEEDGEDGDGDQEGDEEAGSHFAAVCASADGPTVFDAALLVLLLRQPQHAPPLGKERAAAGSGAHAAARAHTHTPFVQKNVLAPLSKRTRPLVCVSSLCFFESTHLPYTLCWPLALLCTISSGLFFLRASSSL